MQEWLVYSDFTVTFLPLRNALCSDTWFRNYFRGHKDMWICSKSTLPQTSRQSIATISVTDHAVRRPGIEPGSQEWESCMIPLHQRRFLNGADCNLEDYFISLLVSPRCLMFNMAHIQVRYLSLCLSYTSYEVRYVSYLIPLVFIPSCFHVHFPGQNTLFSEITT